MSEKLTPYQVEMLSLLLDRLDAVVTMAGSAGFNRDIRVETADANPMARFASDVVAFRLLAKIGREALSEQSP